MSEAKVALVTGSSSGIGEALVKLLAKKGYKVAICGSVKEKVDRVAKEVAELSPNNFQPLSLVLDFHDPDNGEVAVKKTVEHFGRLDALVNNAGLFVRSDSGAANCYEVYRETMAVNIDATVKATLAAINELIKSKGNIVFVSSVASVKPSQLGFSYCMSKSAMSMFAKCLAIDLAPNVRVNICSPGPIATPIFNRIGLNEEMARKIMSVSTLFDRLGEVDEVANSIYFLMSDEAKFVHGHELFIDGGYLVKPSDYSASSRIIAHKQQQK